MVTSMAKVVITTDFLRYAEVNRKGAMGAFFSRLPATVVSKICKFGVRHECFSRP